MMNEIIKSMLFLFWQNFSSIWSNSMPIYCAGNHWMNSRYFRLNIEQIKKRDFPLWILVGFLDLLYELRWGARVAPRGRGSGGEFLLLLLLLSLLSAGKSSCYSPPRVDINREIGPPYCKWGLSETREAWHGRLQLTFETGERERKEVKRKPHHHYLLLIVINWLYPIPFAPSPRLSSTTWLWHFPTRWLITTVQNVPYEII